MIIIAGELRKLAEGGKQHTHTHTHSRVKYRLRVLLDCWRWAVLAAASAVSLMESNLPLIWRRVRVRRGEVPYRLVWGTSSLSAWTKGLGKLQWAPIWTCRGIEGKAWTIDVCVCVCTCGYPHSWVERTELPALHGSFYFIFPESFREAEKKRERRKWGPCLMPHMISLQHNSI